MFGKRSTSGGTAEAAPRQPVAVLEPKASSAAARPAQRPAAAAPAAEAMPIAAIETSTPTNITSQRA